MMCLPICSLQVYAHTGLVWNWPGCWHTASWLTHYVNQCSAVTISPPTSPQLFPVRHTHFSLIGLLKTWWGRGWGGAGLVVWSGHWHKMSIKFRVGVFYIASTLGRFFGWWWGWGRWLISLQHIPCGTHSTGSPTQEVSCKPWFNCVYMGHVSMCSLWVPQS